jgi:hypothetical protein
MLNKDDILSLHDGSDKKDFYMFELSDGKEYVESMIKALEDKTTNK